MLANIEESQPLLFGLFLVVFYTPSVQIIGHSSTQHLSYVSSYHNIQISKEQNVGIGDLWGIRWGLEVWHIAWSCKVFRSNFKLLFLFFQAARNVSPGDLIMAWGLADASNCVVSRLRIQRLRSWCRYWPGQLQQDHVSLIPDQSKATETCNLFMETSYGGRVITTFIGYK